MWIDEADIELRRVRTGELGLGSIEFDQIGIAPITDCHEELIQLSE